MAHGDAREGKWRGNWRMQWAAILFTLPRNMVYPALLPLKRTPRLASSRLNWRPPADLNGLVRFARKTKSGFCACAITFHLACLKLWDLKFLWSWIWRLLSVQRRDAVYQRTAAGSAHPVISVICPVDGDSRTAGRQKTWKKHGTCAPTVVNNYRIYAVTG